jgi:zinc-binding in reverse transcriptase
MIDYLMNVLYTVFIVYFITVHPEITVVNAYKNDILTIDFRRQLVGNYLQEWINLHNLVGILHLNPLENDICVWRWHSSGFFSVHSFYEWLDFGGVVSQEYDIVWKSKIPLKIKIFMWLVRRKRILTKDQLLKRGWQGDLSCIFCGQLETIDHLLVNCSIARVIWEWIASFNNFNF